MTEENLELRSRFVLPTRISFEEPELFTGALLETPQTHGILMASSVLLQWVLSA